MLSSPRFIFLLFMLVLVSQLSVGWLMEYTGRDLSFFVDQGVVMAVLPILLVRIAGKKLGFSLKTPSPKFITAAIFSTLAIAVIIAYLQLATEYITNVPTAAMTKVSNLTEASTVREFLTEVACIALLPALGEEIFFRGICQTALSTRYGNRLGIIITAVLFAVIHGKPWCTHYYFIYGCFFGWIYVAGGTLWLPIICHFVNNLLIVATAYIGLERLSTGMPIWDAIMVACAVAVFLFTIRLISLKFPNFEIPNAKCS